MFKVLHLKGKEYTLVAEVFASSLEEVFELTNHIHHPWWENKKVKCIKQSRSTSVGDIVITPGGQHYKCEAVGWKEIN